MQFKPEKELLNFLKPFVSEDRRQRMEEVLSHRTAHVTVVLEDIYQGHNMSAVLRSCDCFGIQHVHVIENYNDFNIAETIALGSEKWLDIHRYPPQKNASRDCLHQLKDQGYRIMATSPNPAYRKGASISLSEPVALVFGAEKQGISQQVRENCDGFIHIPMYGFTESFNISVAAALLLHDVRNGLQQLDPGHWQLTDEEKLRIRIKWHLHSVKNGEALLNRYYQEKTA